MAEPRGPTTEELRARVLAQLAEAEKGTPPPVVGRWAAGFSQQVQEGWYRGSEEGRTFYDPARPPRSRQDPRGG